VVCDLVLEPSEGVIARQLAEQQEVRRLEIGALDRELLDRVPAIAQDSFVAVDEGDGAPNGRGVEERRVVAHEAELPERSRSDRAVFDGNLERAVRAVVGEGQRVGHDETTSLRAGVARTLIPTATADIRKKPDSG
jgi:hypothetical protein